MDHWGRGAARVLSFLCPAVYLWAGTGQAGTSEGVEGVPAQTRMQERTPPH